MKWKILVGISVLLMLLCMGLASAKNCGGATACECGDTLTSSRVLDGNDDLEACTVADGDYALEIAGNNIELDCDLNMISAATAKSMTGIYINAHPNTYSGITIKHCIIYGFNAGVQAGFVDDFQLNNNFFRPNTSDGMNFVYGFADIWLSGAEDAELKNNNFSASAYGVLMSNIEDIIIYANDFYPAYVGVHGDAVSGVAIEENLFRMLNLTLYAPERAMWFRSPASIDYIHYNYLELEEDTYGIALQRESGDPEIDDIQAQMNSWKNEYGMNYLNTSDIPDYIWDYNDDSTLGEVFYSPVWTP